MNSSFLMIRQKLKAILPPIITTILRNGETYFRRIWYWVQIMRELHGKQPIDKIKLWVSFLISPIISAKNLGKWQNPVLFWDSSVHIPNVGTFDVRANSDDLFHVTPAREPEVFKTLKMILGSGDYFVDAGANIGIYSILAATRVGSTGSIIAIEMMPDTAKILRKHVETNGADQVQVIENALSDKAGQTVMASVPDNLYGQASISDSEGLYSPHKKMVPVMTTTLDDILVDIPMVQLMKIDIEGVEVKALQGALKCLPKINNIIFESWGSDGGDAGKFLKDQGFLISSLSGRDFLAVREKNTNDK